MKQKDIKKVLIKELDYTEYEAEITAKDLLELDYRLFPYFEKWLKDRTISELEVRGFCVSKMMKDNGFTYPASLLALDWLIREPETAKEALSSGIR